MLTVISFNLRIMNHSKLFLCYFLHHDPELTLFLMVILDVEFYLFLSVKVNQGLNLVLMVKFLHLVHLILETIGFYLY
jgi:hypothetical protein